MSTVTQDAEVVEQEIQPTIQQAGGPSIDIQVTTARRFPRSITTFIRRATEMATLTPEIAASCVYAMPRAGKIIEGPSARLAEIVAHAWGNLRIQAGATDHSDRYITGRGEAWDLESNVAVGFEVRRRITNRDGRTYDDDMITVTGNAAASIALRNAVFKAVPSSFWRPIYSKCRQVIAGEARTFAARRDDMIKAFNVMGVTTERLCAALDVKGLPDITLDHMVVLTGFYNALKEGETTIEDAFPESGGLGAIHSGQRKSQQANGHAQPPPVNGVPPTTQATSAPVPENVGVIVDVVDKGNGGVLIKLDTGFQCATTKDELIQSATRHRDSKTRVELGTRPSTKGPQYARVLEELVPAEVQS